MLALVPHLETTPWTRRTAPSACPWTSAPPRAAQGGALLYPRVSNTEDLAPLLAEPDLHLTWITDPALAREQDLLVLPGSKATVGDLAHLTASGMAEALRDAHAAGAWVLGLCGGYQMLGATWTIPGGEGGAKALGRPGPAAPGHRLRGRQDHRGRGCTASGPNPATPCPATRSTRAGACARRRRAPGGGGRRRPGPGGADGPGILPARPAPDDGWRGAFLNQVRRDRGFPPQGVRAADPLESRLDRWAAHLQANLRPGAWERILGAVRP